MKCTAPLIAGSFDTQAKNYPPQAFVCGRVAVAKIRYESGWDFFMCDYHEAHLKETTEACLREGRVVKVTIGDFRPA